jgi:MarR family transcriptional regulator, organic hydroperoxide resistance regulator
MSAKATVQNVDLLALERQVCFALAIANRAVLAVCRPLLKPLRLTQPRYLVMHAPIGSPPEIQPGAVVRQADSRCVAAGFGHTVADAEAPRGARPNHPVARHDGRAHRPIRIDRRWFRALTADGFALRRQALKIPPAVVERLGVDLDELERLHEVLTRFNAAALAAGPFDDEWIDR